MTAAFILGNGRSRQVINPVDLKKHGPVYACNGIYREFTPDVLVATDKPIATAIQESGYSTNHKFYTRAPIPELGGQMLIREYRGFSSGPNAIGLACRDGFDRLFLLGFDLGTTNGQFNNVYAGTQFYKKPSDPPTFSGNWIKQVRTICEDYPTREFIRVVGPESAFVPGLAEIKNMKFMPIAEFQTLLNSKKGMI